MRKTPDAEWEPLDEAQWLSNELHRQRKTLFLCRCDNCGFVEIYAPA